MNKDFVLGVVTGIAIVMTLSFCMFNFYVVKSIEYTKTELTDSITSFRDVFQTELKAGITKAKQEGKAMLEERKGEFINKVGERIKERRAKMQSESDSTGGN